MKRTLKRLHDPRWLVMPDDVNAQIAAWRRIRPDMVLDELKGIHRRSRPRAHAH